MNQQKRILLVEDDVHDLYVITRMLRNIGIEFKRNTTGAQVLEQAREMRPDLILLDLDLPEGDAFVIRQALAADENLAKVPVAALVSEEAAARLHINGHFDARIPKRTTIQQFEQQIISMLYR